MTQKLIIDADCGPGDALAVLTAMVDPSIEVLALTGAAGAVSGRQATRNLQFLTELIDPIKHPRIGQSTAPPTHSPAELPLATQHSNVGSSGLGDIPVEIPDLANRRESAKLIADIVHEFPHEVRVLTLGPLSNLAAAADLDPELEGLLESIVIQGGANGCGDVTPVAEFNIWSDAEAAAQVLSWNCQKTIVPLDVTQPVVLTFDDVDALSDLLAGSETGETLSAMLQFLARANRQALGLEEIPLHAVSALAVAARAEQFSVDAVLAEIEITGRLTRGMTVIDRRPFRRGQTNVDIVSTIDHHGVVDYFSRGIRRAAS